MGLQLALARMRKGERAAVYITDPAFGYGSRVRRCARGAGAAQGSRPVGCKPNRQAPLELRLHSRPLLSRRAMLPPTLPGGDLVLQGSFSFPSVPPSAQLVYDLQLLEWEQPEEARGLELLAPAAPPVLASTSWRLTCMLMHAWGGHVHNQVPAAALALASGHTGGQLNRARLCPHACAPSATTQKLDRRAMLFEERLEAAERRRAEGNALFQEGKLTEALGKYALVSAAASLHAAARASGMPSLCAVELSALAPEAVTHTHACRPHLARRSHIQTRTSACSWRAPTWTRPTL